MSKGTPKTPLPSLNFSVRQTGAGAKSSCTVLPVPASGRLDADGKALDRASGGVIGAAIAAGEFGGKAGDTQLLYGAGEAARILLLGAGKDKPTRDELRSISAAAAKALTACKTADAQIHTPALKLAEADALWFYRTLARDLAYHRYRYATTLSNPKAGPSLRRVALLVGGEGNTRRVKAALTQGAKTGAGINFARELANLPGNHCTPEHLAREARKLARGSERTTCKVLNEKAMAELGMRSLLSVSAGSAQPARLIVLEYKGGKRGDAPHVLVGKGITFDSGGISLKPGAKMDEMKFDMGGAASVLGTIKAVIDLQLPLNVVCIVAAAENMPSSTATKPGDVVTSMAGITIEILNTDAEGRLVLCDALTYAARFKPASVIDVATLTGACVVALGSHASGLYANDDGLAEDLLAAGVEAHDRAWRMPLWDDYQKQLDSNFADVANIGGPGAGSVTAACFLARFTKDYRWAHLDIAGAAWNSSSQGRYRTPRGSADPVSLRSGRRLTRVGFYILDNTDPESRQRLALRLTEKAHSRGHRVFINCENEPQASDLDERLWTFQPASFLPHALIGDNPREQICIGWGQEPDGHDDLLINLQTRVPPFFARFRRIAELVNREPARLEALRASWRHYRERGCELEEHRLSNV